MDSDFTQQQSLGGLQRSEKLSLGATVPPAEVPGYRIERLLGEGAFGQVWLGNDLNTGRQVAIKFYLHRGGVDFTLLRREVKHLINMSTGRYIVQVLNVGWDAEPAYYVMEYLENGSLEDLVRARGALTISDTVKLLREMADGLSFAHSKGVLHCDLKPANVVLDHDLRPRLADFGQSRMSDDQTPSLGTLFYMAPEQADLNAAPDAAWDVYALGAIAYTMLVGSPPYRTPDIVETLDTASSLPERLRRYRETIEQAQRPKLHYKRRGIDKGLCQIVDRCLAPSPSRRYKNVQQVIEALDAWQLARSRRPLYIMGIVGPVLLLLLMMLFSARSISVANQIALQRVQQRSLESNQFAAMFAARTLEKEIEALFRIVEQEAAQPELLKRLAETVEANGRMIDSLTAKSGSAAQKKEFIADKVRAELEEYLGERLQRLINRSSGNSAAVFNSLFVNEARGVNMATTFASPEYSASTPVGGNFSYRSYFNGMSSDGDPTKPLGEYKPTRRTTLSASFRSTSTGMYKVGIAAPIWAAVDSPEDEDQAADRDPIAVLVMTINLGDFELLQKGADDTDNRFAILVDGRTGQQRGTILQHPLLQAMDTEVARKAAIPQIAPHVMDGLSDGAFTYNDVATSLPEGEAFEGEWIAAISQVRLPRQRDSGESSKPKGTDMSDLWVLVQERGQSVKAPLTQLGKRLQTETYIELGTVLAVIAVLWFFVLRINNYTSGKEKHLRQGESPNSGFITTIQQDSPPDR